MRFFRLAVVAVCAARFAAADLTPDQKAADFMQLAAQYAKNYGPYELKRDVFGFDLYNISPWLTQVKLSKNDLEFYDICVNYVASLQDSHDEFTLRSTFDAWLHFDGDIYDGRFLIDYIDRSYLARTKYPFTTGDELISVDGVAVADLITKFQPYAVNGSSNPVSRARLAAATITERYQGWYPFAHQIGSTASIVVKLAATGASVTYSIPWDIIGTPVTTAGTLISPFSKGRALVAPVSIHHQGLGTETRFYRKGLDSDSPKFDNPWGVRVQSDGPADVPDSQPAYMQASLLLQEAGAATREASFTDVSGLSPFGSIFPNWNPPSDFAVRLGLKTSDYFLSGTFGVGNSKVGYIRIPTMSPTSTSAALAQFKAEIAYFQTATDGLVVDIMANGGGSICYGQSLAQYLQTKTFRGIAYEIRASLFWQQQFSSSIISAQLSGAPSYIPALYQAYLNDIQTALTQNRARTGALPICGVSFDVSPQTDANGNLISYTKPILVLTDNFTLSAAESFLMQLQDSKRVTIFGMRTDGGGGNVNSFSNATAYSEGNIRITQSIITRAAPVQVPGFPALDYYDGVGIQPDIIQDYMTANNLATGGTAFVKAFSTAIGDLITKAKGQ